MENHGSENNNNNNNRGHIVYDFEHYSVHQIMALEKLFTDYSENPTETQALAMISNNPILSDIGPQEIQVWFENRRYLKEQNQEGVMFQAVNEKLSEVLILEHEFLSSGIQHMEKEKEFMENIKLYIIGVQWLDAPEMPRNVLRNAKMNAMRRLLQQENDFIQSHLELLRKEHEYMEKTKTPRYMLTRDGRFAQLLEIVHRLEEEM